MDGLEMIHTRRSVRQFTTEPVGADSVGELLRAAMAAPSAGNQQPWRFVVVSRQGVARRRAPDSSVLRDDS